mgnify:CR=1 FL=1
MRSTLLVRLGTTAVEIPEKLGVSVERWHEITVACSQRVEILKGDVM